jgi:hypothetical protein
MGIVYCAIDDLRKYDGADKAEFTKNQFRQGMIENISLADAGKYQKDYYGILRSVNTFTNNIRKTDMIERYLYWPVENDVMSKEDQLEQCIKKIGIEPSLINESYKSYHTYFAIKGDVDEETYIKILKDFLIPLYVGDPSCSQNNRLLRLEGYHHLKNPHNPFLIKTIHRSNVEYTQEQFLRILKNKMASMVKTKDMAYYKKTGIFNRTLKSKYSAEHIAKELKGYRTQAGQYMACCPAHDDKNPSFAIKQLDDKILYFCHSGCSFQKIIEALRKRGLA